MLYAWYSLPISNRYTFTNKKVDIVDTGTTSTSGYHDSNDDGDGDDDDVGHNNNSVDTKELYDNFAASVVKPNMQTLPPPKTPILSDADAVVATMTGDLLLPKSPLTPIRSPLPINMAGRSLTPTMTPSPVIPVVGSRGSSARPPTGSASQPGRSLSREPSAETSKGSPFNSATIGEVRPPTSQTRSRPDTGTASGARLSSARPPSARRAPPRPKSSLVKEEVEPYRPTTGKVAHVIMDNTEDADDDNYIVREVTVSASKPSGLSDLDETPELTLSNGMSADSLLPPDQRGLLVNQILETQKELEDKISGKSDDAPKIEQKLNELSLAEVEKLKNLIQVCSRSANPLAKLLDYMAEDVDSMQKEYNNFQEESKRLSIQLENAKEETDKFLQNLKHDLHEIERKIKDKEDGVLASQMKIIQQEERIEEIVTGFERVRSGKSAVAEKHMPPADEILLHIQGQSSFNSSATVGIGVGGGGIGVASSFKIPESFMVNSGSVPSSASGGIGETSPFNRGRMWASGSTNNNNNNNLSFDKMSLVEDEQPSIQSTSSFSNGFSAQKNVGRSGGGGGGAFRRSATEFQMDMDVDNFNPWS
ncbi:unnamed protein product [Orchesella dallaii]|uniref:TRAF3-interacting protein 1 C-terminal domain-containing protein n=1 Tax=Orchesella dallaii TaxID=48710 RepID=A0ABP1RI79_9HEXA